MNKNMFKDMFLESDKIYDKIIGNFIVAISEHEKNRSKMMSLLEKERREEIPTIERSFFHSSDPKVLGIVIPWLPVSLNRVMKGYFVRGKNVYSSLREWWSIKIKNALHNIEYINSDTIFTPFNNAIILIKFTFDKDILRDIDNYVTKNIIDALEDNGVIVNDNCNVLMSIIPIFTTGEKHGIVIYVTDDDRLMKIAHDYDKKYSSLLKMCNASQKRELNDDDCNEFFDIKNT